MELRKRVYRKKRLFVEDKPAFLLLDDFGDWLVTFEDAKKFRELWEAETPFNRMCLRLKMTDMKLLLLIADQSRKGEIQPRKIGIGI